MLFSKFIHFISPQVFDVTKFEVQCKKNKRADPDFTPFNPLELGEKITFKEGDKIFIISSKLLEEFDSKFSLVKKS